MSKTRTPAKPKASPRKRSKSPARLGSSGSVHDAAHTMEAEEVLASFGVDPDVGLSPVEVEKLRMQYGKNELPKPEGDSLLQMFMAQFEDPLVRILLGAAGISLFFAIIEGTSEGLIEFGVIMTILVFNAIIGVWQEKRAEDAIEALQSYNPEKAFAIRSGKRVEVLASELVPSDIVLVGVGDKVPADMRVVKMFSTAIKVEQAALTGESASVNKSSDVIVDELDCELQQKVNCLFSGTDLVYGKCVGVVIKTGARTEIGKIAKSLQETEDTASPLKQKLDDFGEILTKIITYICVACWAINVFSFKLKGERMTQNQCHETLPEGFFLPRSTACYFWGSLFYFKEAVALAVAAIPEGLPAVVTTCLALGTRRMAKRNALIRHLPAVETLGCCSVICSDKTGTLTTNQMSVQKILCFGKSASDKVRTPALCRLAAQHRGFRTQDVALGRQRTGYGKLQAATDVRFCAFSGRNGRGRNNLRALRQRARERQEGGGDNEHTPGALEGDVVVQPLRYWSERQGRLGSYGGIDRGGS